MFPEFDSCKHDSSFPDHLALSKKIDNFEGISEFSLLLKICKPIIINKIIREYKPKLVNEIWKFPIKAEENPKRLTTSNWSKGEKMIIIM